MNPLFRGSAVIAATLLSSAFILSAIPSVAETPVSPFQQQKQEPSQTPKSETKADSEIGSSLVVSKAETKVADGTTAGSKSGMMTAVITEATDPAGGLSTVVNSKVAPSASYTATAYSLTGRTASGKRVSKGLIAADPSVLPLGTRVWLEAGSYSGEYLVADTGGGVRGKRIDIWTPSSHEASRFGRRLVKLTVLSYGPKRSARRRQRNR